MRNVGMCIAMPAFSLLPGTTVATPEVSPDLFGAVRLISLAWLVLTLMGGCHHVVSGVIRRYPIAGQQTGFVVRYVYQ